MKVVSSHLPDVLIVEPRVFTDDRGFFFESYQQNRYQESGVVSNFLQDNISFSSRGVLRGLHYQVVHAQAKLLQVLQGEVYDVAMDIRIGSPSFGKWVGVHLSGENKRQLYIPEGFAHGFLTLSETALVHYKCSDYYSKSDERGVRWDDPDVDISWPELDIKIDPRDASFPCLKDVEKNSLPRFYQS